MLILLPNPSSRWVRVRPVTALRTVGKIELSAQRLDLEDKQSELLCDSEKSWPFVKYKQLIFTEHALTPVCPESLCVIYEENAIVKSSGRDCIDSRQTCLIISLSCMIHRSSKYTCSVGVQSLAQTSGSNICNNPPASYRDWSFCFVETWCHKLTFALTQQTNLGKEAHFYEKRLGGMQREVEGRGKEKDIANLLKGSYFHESLVWPFITRCPYPFKAVDSELDIDRTMQINYLLGLHFIDKSFGQMISNNHKWIRVRQ